LAVVSTELTIIRSALRGEFYVCPHNFFNEIIPISAEFIPFSENPTSNTARITQLTAPHSANPCRKPIFPNQVSRKLLTQPTMNQSVADSTFDFRLTDRSNTQAWSHSPTVQKPY